MTYAAAKKSLGQHWLHDESALKNIVAAAEVKPGDTVLEVGPGLGTLTEHLLAAGASVQAVEFDETLIPILQKRFAGNNLFTVEHQYKAP